MRHVLIGVMVVGFVIGGTENVSGLVRVPGGGTDTGNAPGPYPPGLASSQDLEYLGVDPGGFPGITDGVSFTGGTVGKPWMPGQIVNLQWTLTSTTTGAYGSGEYFRFWVDWTHDGDWDDPGEKMVDSVKVEGIDWFEQPGIAYHPFPETFVVPSYCEGFTGGSGATWARAWLGFGAPPPAFGDGITSYGEIEDYEVQQVIPEAASIIVWSLLFGLAWAGGTWRFFRRRRGQ